MPGGITPIAPQKRREHQNHRRHVSKIWGRREIYRGAMGVLFKPWIKQIGPEDREQAGISAGEDDLKPEKKAGEEDLKPEKKAGQQAGIWLPEKKTVAGEEDGFCVCVP
ncbi:hypothetical protein Hanom_Chr13g01190691 [Helianthus anomalus]